MCILIKGLHATDDFQTDLTFKQPKQQLYEFYKKLVKFNKLYLNMGRADVAVLGTCPEFLQENTKVITCTF